MARLQSKFQNLNAKVNQKWTTLVSKFVSTAAEWIILSFDTPYYTEQPWYSPKTEIKNWVNMCHRRGCSFLQLDRTNWQMDRKQYTLAFSFIKSKGINIWIIFLELHTG